MKRFDSGITPVEWSKKHNFVDRNNVLVGFDTDQQCCECATSFYAATCPAPESDAIQMSDEDLEPYVFDPDFFADPGSDDFDGGGAVGFRLVADGKPDVFLILKNAHNGYYSHGFDMTRDGKPIREGSI